MKRICSIILCALLVVSMAISVYAVSSVPEPVMMATESVVRVLAEYADGYTTGSGFVIKSGKDETLIATNYHVVEGKPYSISVWLGEEETINATILAYTNQKDMCILKLAYPVSLKPLTFAKSSAKQGDAVYAVGFPSVADYLSDKEAHTSADATITDGIVSAVREATMSNYGTPTKILQINAAINPGNSGGPLFNTRGEVVGINTYGINDSQGIFGAIAVSELAAFLADYSIRVSQSPNITLWIIFAFAIAGIVGTIVTLIIVTRKRKMKTPKKTQPTTIPLYEYMAANPNGTSIHNAVAMLLPVALQLRDMHNNGYAHLQVSPNSILVGKTGAILCNASLAETDRYTSGYAAPEIYKGSSAGNRSDIYSFCALLYYVSTGKQPLNALSRTDNDRITHEDTSYAEIINMGLALDPINRYATMQDIIINLSAYNVGPFINTLSVLEPNIPKKLEKQKAKPSRKKIVLAVAIVLIVALLGSYGGCYFGAKVSAKNGKFEIADKFLFAPPITQLHDATLVEYIEAGRLLETRNYDAAYRIFEKLDDYLDSMQLSNEAEYRLALQHADKGNFDLAIRTLDYLKAIHYKDSTEKIKDIKYRWAWSLIDEGKYIEALNKLNTITGYSDVDDTIVALTETIYLEGQDLYYNGDYDGAKELFEYLSPYKDSYKYLALIDARDWRAYVDIENTVTKLVEIFYFEDAAELLVSNTDIACQFLLGNWETSDGEYYFEIELSNDEEYSYWSSYNLPWYGGSFIIENGIYSVSDDSYEDKPQYAFTLLTPDCMDIYCYKNSKTYTLYRQ